MLVWKLPVFKKRGASIGLVGCALTQMGATLFAGPTMQREGCCQQQATVASRQHTPSSPEGRVSISTERGNSRKIQVTPATAP